MPGLGVDTRAPFYSLASKAFTPALPASLPSVRRVGPTAAPLRKALRWERKIASMVCCS